jgi:hypothetical protein
MAGTFFDSTTQKKEWGEACFSWLMAKEKGPEMCYRGLLP